MECPRCGSKFKVINTSSKDDNTRTYLRSKAAVLIDWYSSDYIVRRRRCSSNECGYDTVTVELFIPDLFEMMRICKDEQFLPVDSVPQSKNKIRDN
jgi:hypothetical protein